MEHPGKFGVLLHNKVVNYGLAFLKNWGDHFHGKFLFISGDVIQRNRVPDTGQMYLFEIVTISAGLYYIFRFHFSGCCSLKPVLERKMSEELQHDKNVSKWWMVILFWLLIAPIPAALTFQSPHALRAENMIVPLTIISAFGLTNIFKLIRKSRINGYGLFGILFRNVLFVILYSVIAWSFVHYLHNYYLHMSKEYPFSSQYGVKELVDYVQSKDKTYKNIVVTDKYDQPYILFLFYSKYPPDKFQKYHKLTQRDRYGFSTVEGYSNFIFKPIDWDDDKVLYPGSLIIGSNEEIPDETNITKRIYGSNGYLYFKVVEN